MKKFGIQINDIELVNHMPDVMQLWSHRPCEQPFLARLCGKPGVRLQELISRSLQHLLLTFRQPDWRPINDSLHPEVHP